MGVAGRRRLRTRVGKWIDHHGGRGALIASIVVIALGQAVLAFSHGLAVWYLEWTIIGVGMAMGLYDRAFATVAGLLGKEAGPSITGITLVAGLASSVFWTLGATLIGALGWRGLLLAYAGLMLMVNLPMVWLCRRHRLSRDAGGAGVPKSPAQRRALVLLGAFFALRWFISSGISVHVLSLLQGIGLTAVPGRSRAGSWNTPSDRVSTVLIPLLIPYISTKPVAPIGPPSNSNAAPAPGLGQQIAIAGPFRSLVDFIPVERAAIPLDRVMPKSHLERDKS